MVGLIVEGEDEGVRAGANAGGRECGEEALGGETVGVGSLVPDVDRKQRATLLAGVMRKPAGDGRGVQVLVDSTVIGQTHTWCSRDVDIAHGTSGRFLRGGNHGRSWPGRPT